MSIAKPEQSAIGLQNLDPTVRALMSNVANHRYHHVVAKILVSAAIALGSCIGAAAPASADPNSFGTDPNPFGSLSCSCQETTPPGGPALKEDLNRGIRGGLSA
jgi:hypothetical protein